MSSDQEKREKITILLKERSQDGKMSCTVARQIAEEIKVPYRQVGDLCNELKIKITACELGCF
ncbi:MAG: hypothetical protein GXY50_04310 [Syntrophomonadaceae bacterium]|mgnify:CR=1 FL=1|nr:hypothetical protein [Syntrophomonadaceae bacterium]